MAAGGALINDRHRVKLRGGDRRGRRGVGHALQRLRHHHRVAVYGTVPKAPAANLLLTRVFQPLGETFRLHRHGALYHDRPGRRRLAKAQRRKGRTGGCQQ